VYLYNLTNLNFKVWKAEAESICGYDGTVVVAVKTTKENAPEKEKLDLLQEMKVMQTIGHHPNVVTLLGVCTEKGKTKYAESLSVQMLTRLRECHQFSNSPENSIRLLKFEQS
jgi:serine/threonine protein kinase